MQYRLLKLAMYTIVLNILFVPLNSSIAAIFGYCTIVLSVLYPFTGAYENGKLKVNRLVLAMVVVLVISAITSASSLKKENLQQYLVSSVSVVAFYWALSNKNNNDNGIVLEDVFRINYALCIIYIVYAFGPFDFKYMTINIWGDKVFSMGLGNPNVVAVEVMFSVILLIIQNMDERKKFWKAINWILIFLLVNILFKLSSRTVIVSLMTILFCVVVRIKKKNSLWIAYAAILIPVLIVIIQPLLTKQGGVELLGKNLESGRGEMFAGFLETVKDAPHHFVFGRIFEYGFENYHNASLTILGNMGIVGLILFWVFWCGQFKYLNMVCKDKGQYLAYIALIAFVVHSSSESMTMIGTIPYGMLVVILTEIAKGNIKRKRDKFNRDYFLGA